MTERGAAGAACSILSLYAGNLEFGIGEMLQGDRAVPNLRINAYGSAGLPFPFGHEPAMRRVCGSEA